MLLHARPQLFEFEQHASENLTYIPMCVRFNLDRCGLKLSLSQWQALPYDMRMRLCCYPLVSETTPAGADPAGPDGFAAALAACVEAAGGGVLARMAPADEGWRQIEAVPPAVLRQCELQAIAPPDSAWWRELSAFQRYVLLKLSRRETRNHDFQAAWKEFTAPKGADAPNIGDHH